VLGAGGGVATELRRPKPRKKTPVPPPAVLVAALAAERALLTSLDVSLAASPSSRELLTQLRTDHLAHEQALLAAIAQASDPDARPSPSATPTTPITRPQPLTTARLRSAEQLASGQAADRAAQLTGRNATLLASIAACEATHAELLG
jgi:hypothetical protein